MAEGIYGNWSEDFMSDGPFVERRSKVANDSGQICSREPGHNGGGWNWRPMNRGVLHQLTDNGCSSISIQVDHGREFTFK